MANDLKTINTDDLIDELHRRFDSGAVVVIQKFPDEKVALGPCSIFGRVWGEGHSVAGLCLRAANRALSGLHEGLSRIDANYQHL